MVNLSNVSDWLGATALSRELGLREWIVPSVQAVHLIAIAAVMGSALMFGQRAAGLAGRDESVAIAARRFLPWTWWGLLALAASGAILILAEPARELMNQLFRWKMALVLVVVLLTALLARLAGDRAFVAVSPPQKFALRAGAVISLLIWVAIVTCGRWIAYTQY